MAQAKGPLSPAEKESRRIARKTNRATSIEDFHRLPDEAVTRPQVAAKVLGISLPTFWRWCKAGKLTPLKLSAGVTALRVGQVRQVASGL